jgi:uncharacterized protein (TIGR02145 family)
MKSIEVLNLGAEDCGSLLRSVRKNKAFFLTFALVFFFCTNLHAQVTIGGATEPAAGAILDLNSTAKGGLVLSNVTITDPEKIPHDATVFPGITNVDDDVNPNLRGAMVYNDGNGTSVSPGIYIWNGYCWTNDGRDIIINPLSITVDGAVKTSAVFAEGGSVTLALVSPQPDVQYEWYKNDLNSNSGGELLITGETYATPTDLEVETYYYYCKATSLICSSFNAVSDVIIVDVINPAALPSGIGILSGTACFDVALSNSGNSCGNPVDRLSTKRSFTFSSTEDYTFAVLSGSVDNLFFYYKNLDPTNPVVQKLEQNGNTVTVTFYSDLDTRAQGHTRAQALKAELYAVYNGSQATKRSLSVSDCRCCPGLLVVGGEYKQHSAHPTVTTFPGEYLSSIPDARGTEAVIKGFNNSHSGNGKTGSDLCYYYRDANASSLPAATPTSYSWADATTVCQTTQGVDAVDVPSEWRRPNQAELALIGQLVANNTFGALNSGVGSQTDINTAISQGDGYANGIAFPAGSYTMPSGTYNLSQNNYYWSSTEYSGTVAWAWNPPARNSHPNRKQTDLHYVRCVRSF